MMKAAFCVLLFTTLVLGDVYMHNPRGSNNRASEANTDTTNQQRMFNSQNNAKGGYCWGPSMYYYEGSQLTIEWTAQHGCGSPKLGCQIILQYMCGSSSEPAETLIRDGATTTTITNDNYANIETTGQRAGQYSTGMHENGAYYAKCTQRSRNKGLYTADQVSPQNNLPRDSSATRTRSQTGGTRHGFECPEERDYYPYWVPNPWKDIAVLTDDISRCAYYKAESGNVKSRWECSVATAETEVNCKTAGGVWTEVPAWGIDAPDCVLAPTSRDNHLGNGDVGYANTYNWTLPDTEPCMKDDTCQCVLRLRYNITSSDIPFDADTTNDADPFLKNNPTIEYDNAQVNGDDGSGNPTGKLTLAINTNQFSRTFQDRSQVFAIRPRPDGVAASTRIYNLNVRGKRGNIVQTYPSTEYDFIPNDLAVRVGDYIHFQWTGCDTNPAGNAGEGTDQTDRHNILQIKDMGTAMPYQELDFQNGVVPLFDDASTRYYFALLGQTGCKTGNVNNNDPQNCYKLNAAGQYFDGGLLKMNTTGEFYYMSTRNNNFSNRGQKATLSVVPLLPSWAVAVVVIGAAATGIAGVAGAGMFYAKSHPHSFLAEKLASFEK